MIKMLRSVLVMLALIMLAHMALAQGAMATAASDGGLVTVGDDPRVRLRGGVGIVALEAREWVFTRAGSTNNLSLLIWQTLAPTLTADLAFRPGNGWTFDLDGQIAGLGDSYMVDYDWLVPFNRGYGPNGWSDRSKHPDTDLVWYFNGALTLGHDVATSETGRINVNAGIELTSVHWTAYGGSYVYSSFGRRDSVGNFPPGERGISYGQSFPEIFVGIDGQTEHGPWELSGGAKAGVTVFATATDVHWQRNLRFDEIVDPAPVLGADVRLAYSVHDGMQLFVSADVNNVFLGRSDTIRYNHRTGARPARFKGASGAQLLPQLSARTSAALSETGPFRSALASWLHGTYSNPHSHMGDNP